MTNVSGWVTFKEIVDGVQLNEGDAADQGQFARKLKFALNGYEFLRLRELPATRTVELPISGEMRCLVLPGDFLKFVSVGQWYDNKFHKFLPNSTIVAKEDYACGVDERSPKVFNDRAYYIGYYKLDVENNRVIIEAPLNITTAVLNYTPTGIKMDGLTYIPRMCRDVIERYVEKEVALRDKNMSGGDKMLFQSAYVNALNVFRGLQYDVDELFNEYYEHIKTQKRY